MINGVAAAELAMSIEDNIRTNAEHVCGMGGWANELYRFAREDALAGGNTTPRPHSFPRPPLNVAREIHYMAFDAAHMALWRRGRVVYDIDPDLWGSLSNWKTTTRLPAGLFRRLPHPDPFIAFPVPLRSPMKDSKHGGAYMETVGCFVNGRTYLQCSDHGELGPLSQVSTHAPTANGNLGLLMVSVPHYADGTTIMAPLGGPDLAINRVSLRVAEREATLAELVAGIYERYDWYSASGQVQEALGEMIRATVGALVYLCSRTAEVEQTKAVGKLAARRLGGGGSKGPVKAPNVYQVGYRVGSMLRRARVERTRFDGPPTGRVMPPHIRAAHPHLYRVGVGRQEIELKWLDPIRVNMPDDDAGVTTVIPVKERTKR